LIFLLAKEFALPNAESFVIALVCNDVLWRFHNDCGNHCRLKRSWLFFSSMTPQFLVWKQRPTKWPATPSLLLPPQIIQLLHHRVMILESLGTDKGLIQNRERKHQ